MPRFKLKQSVLYIFVIVFFLISLALILYLNLSVYELEENSSNLKTRMSLLNSYINKFANISFPISYFLQHYEKYAEMPIIYIITPTNNRDPAQMAHLTRMRNTLWLVPKIFWIIIEDSKYTSNKLKRFLEYSNLSHVHLNEITPDDLLVETGKPKWTKPRGVNQRNKGIDWLRRNSDKLHHEGVVYFADDDNTYDIRLFEEMRYTKKVSVWPVAFSGRLFYERPICKDGKVIDWFVLWGPNRPFPMDMAGFAVNLNLLMAHPSARFTNLSPRGGQESHLLGNLVRVKDLECKANNCTKIYVWHTNTRAIDLDLAGIAKKKITYDLDILDQI